MLRVTNTAEVPHPGYWEYVQPETNKVFRHIVYRELLKEIFAHRRANNIPVGLQWEDAVMDQIGRRVLPHQPERVVNDEEPSIWERGVRFANAMAKHAASGFQTVDMPTWERRRDKCTSCDQWNGFGDMFHVSCKACGCSGKKLSWATETCPLGKW